MTELLLITADKELRRFAKAALESLPIRVLADCPSAHQAMEIFRKERPKLMLVDLFLPESSG
ncbi:hypothetical protein, partial [Bradyrhizobium sp. NBAIM08]|uniref:hypothetical protein n=1 Tax=Bradyrhizobium sp. NBAIM08 TaxID=2793815 RepID=UPI001CD36F9A